MQDIVNNKEQKQNFSAQYNFQVNISIQNSLDSISKLPKELQPRAMDLLEKYTNRQMALENRIVEVYEEDIKQRKEDMQQKRLLRYIGAFAAVIFLFSLLVAIVVFAFLVLDKDMFLKIIEVLLHFSKK